MDDCDFSMIERFPSPGILVQLSDLLHLTKQLAYLLYFAIHIVRVFHSVQDFAYLHVKSYSYSLQGILPIITGLLVKFFKCHGVKFTSLATRRRVDDAAKTSGHAQLVQQTHCRSLRASKRPR